jgi:hypothetical protein
MARKKHALYRCPARGRCRRNYKPLGGPLSGDKWDCNDAKPHRFRRFSCDVACGGFDHCELKPAGGHCVRVKKRS